ncbi:hypothetical protein QJ130_00780 [Metamycoplasma hyosynoviae]|uniref:Lipoprotein n=2 Tax=Metamycoplasma hyosynoviae TaxID=29559 RepID=A0AAP4AL80_9BACT|nr:hypothetical protein [Metamycoplasma hyosynoviae]MDC8913764.1 hypothetical protein [Metamycoplasma hyosynoviae]MDC8916378.1 hypothetical protein [Metamycoplasma hyosynoviae]MDC8920367.1 hypothetical protein [Metamycoplasma hyosynoviae]MDD1360990.1 hypothetical protein [Metamycoplasma hyosynoviae]MDD1362004.1 hypothetical protein [Metamycoplasma hyosynoviae]
MKKIFLQLTPLSFLTLPFATISCSQKLSYKIIKTFDQGFEIFGLNIHNNLFNFTNKTNDQKWLTAQKNYFEKELPDLDFNNKPAGISKNEYRTIKENFIKRNYKNSFKDDATEREIDDFLVEKNIDNIANKNSLIVLNTYEEYLELTKPYWTNNFSYNQILNNLNKKHTRNFFENKSVILILNVPILRIDLKDGNLAVLDFDVINLEKKFNEIKINLNANVILEQKSINYNKITNNNYSIEIEKQTLFGNKVSNVSIYTKTFNKNWLEEIKK